MYARLKVDRTETSAQAGIEWRKNALSVLYLLEQSRKARDFSIVLEGK